MGNMDKKVPPGLLAIDAGHAKGIGVLGHGRNVLNWTTALPAQVLGDVEMQLAASQLVDLCGAQRWNAKAPLVNGGSLDAELPCRFTLGAEMSNNVGCEHLPTSYPTGNDHVNDATSEDGAVSQVMEKKKTSEATEETMGHRVRTLREAKGVSQSRLAAIVGVTRAAIHKLENGDTTHPKNDTLLRIADALGTDPYFLVWGPGRVAPGEPPPDRPTDATGRFRVGGRGTRSR